MLQNPAVSVNTQMQMIKSCICFMKDFRESGHSKAETTARELADELSVDRSRA